VSLPLDCERARLVTMQPAATKVMPFSTPSLRNASAQVLDFSTHDNGTVKKSA
jgi:hypothetical protein